MVSSWSVTNGLPFAPHKSHVLTIGKQLGAAYYVKLDCVSEVRDLGFLFDNRLCFDRHIRSIFSKAFSRTHSLFKALKTTGSFVLIKAYKTYVRPIVECGTTVFNPHLRKDIMLPEGVQNNFTRKLVTRCSGVDYHYIYHYIPCGVVRQKMFGLPSLESRRQRNDLVMASKIITGPVSTLPPSLNFYLHVLGGGSSKT